MHKVVGISLVVLLSAVAHCSGQSLEAANSKGSASNTKCECQLDSTQRKAITTVLTDIKKSQEETEKKALKNKKFLEEKIGNLEKKLEEVSQTVIVYYQTLNNIFGHLTKSFVPASKGAASEMAVCPLTTCYRKGRISLKAAESITPVSTILGVSSTEGCALLCNQNTSCQAYLYDSSDKVCELVNSIDLLVDEEQNEFPITIWIKSSAKLGKCPSTFYLKHKASRYFFSRQRITWDLAAKQCKKRGGKLAELTSKSEVEFIRKQYMARSLRYWLVGGLQTDREGNEPADGWTWYYSKIPIPTPGFAWKPGNPDNHLNLEHNMNAQVKFGKLYFNDLAASYRAFGYLCECIELQ